MTLRSNMAKMASGTLTWGLRHVARRPGGTLPGKVALRIDPAIVRELRGKLRDGSIVVVGTNGKTTVTNLMADVLEQAGRSVLCNRTGANLKSGIASALLQGRPSDWGVIECDELWLAHVLPDLRASWVLLLNLFRDQLDRCGEIDRIQESIVSALVASPETGLVFNADDPLCAFVARRTAEERARAGLAPLRTVAFGVGESMHLAQNAVADATMCQACSHMFTYEYRQYGQLGAYACPACGFARPALDYEATGVELAPDGLSFDVQGALAAGVAPVRLHASLAGTYNVYNVLAIFACAATVGCAPVDVQRAIDAFDPHNGRLQRSVVDGRATLLNLAKNPTGFNQNLRIVAADTGPHAVAFFINDQVVDGHDVSWIWDIDFEELVAAAEGGELRVFAGGTRRNDLQVRLKYAGVDAALVDGIEDVFATLAADTAAGAWPADAPVYAIANYSALPPVKQRLDAMADPDGAESAPGRAAAAHDGGTHAPDRPGGGVGGDCAVATRGTSSRGVGRGAGRTSAQGEEEPNPQGSQDSQTPIVIAYVLPDLLNLYGDGGNVRILEQRLRWRGVPVEVRRIEYGMPLALDDVDLVFLGGGPDREQKLATETLAGIRDDLARYIDEKGPVLAICGGFQILGRTWLLGDDEVPGLGLIDMETRRPGTSADRLIGNVALRSPLASAPVVGFENHAGRTYLDAGVSPLGEVVSRTGTGNNDDEGVHADGVVAGNVVGTYLHGTLLAKNPELADWLLERAMARHASRTGEDQPALASLDDRAELAANEFMRKKIV